MSSVKEFDRYREEMNEKILGAKNKVINRIFNLDSHSFAAGALDVRTKEMIGLSSSLVLRCDDCVKYHLKKCVECGITKDEIMEVLSIANLIGGTIIIPHLRKAMEFLLELIENKKDKE